MNSQQVRTWRVFPGPSCVKYVCAMELFERMAFYGTRAVLVLYLTESLGYSEPASISIYSFFMALCYFVPLISGFVADVYIGRFRAICVFACFYIIGLALLVGSSHFENSPGSLIALVFIATGTGGIKPSIATFGAEQISMASADVYTSFFFIFYFCASAGTMFAYILVPLLRDAGGFVAAFGLSLGAMVFGTLSLLVPRSKYVHHPLADRCAYASFYSVWRAGRLGYVNADAKISGKQSAETESSVLIAQASMDSGVVLPYRCERLKRAQLHLPAVLVHAVASVVNLLPLFAMLPVYWAIFDSQGSIWTLQRKHMNNCIISATACLSPAYFGALNPLLVMLLVPVFERLIFPLCRRLGWHPTPLRRMSVGMLAACVSFVLTYVVQFQIDGHTDQSVSVWMQLPQIFCLATAELLVSATGLEWAYAQSPANMKGTVVSLYLAMVAVGNLLTGVLFEGLVDILSTGQIILLLSGLMLASTCIFGLLAMRFQALPPLTKGPFVCDASMTTNEDPQGSGI